MRTWWVILGLVVGVAGGVASAGSGQSGLSGLDAQLNGTGRVGAVTPGTNSQIEAPDAGATPEARAARPIRPAASAGEVGTSDVTPKAPAAAQEEYQRTEARVAACRVEVARRRQVPPAKVAAGTVTVRFTVEPSGRVRDAEAISALDTDPEVSACAKRVLTEWVFAKHAGKPITVQRTYQLAGQ